MRNSERAFLGMLALAAIITIGWMLVDTVPQFHTPKFQSGDCTSYVFEADEFLPRRLGGQVLRVKSVGSNRYLLEEKFLGRYLESTQMIKYFDEDNVKVDCQTGEEL